MARGRLHASQDIGRLVQLGRRRWPRLGAVMVACLFSTRRLAVGAAVLAMISTAVLVTCPPVPSTYSASPRQRFEYGPSPAVRRSGPRQPCEFSDAAANRRELHVHRVRIGHHLDRPTLGAAERAGGKEDSKQHAATVRPRERLRDGPWSTTMILWAGAAGALSDEHTLYASGTGVDPLRWTPDERQIRCRPWTRGRGRSDHGGASRTSLRPRRCGWFSTRARRSIGSRRISTSQPRRWMERFFASYKACRDLAEGLQASADDR